MLTRSERAERLLKLFEEALAGDTKPIVSTTLRAVNSGTMENAHANEGTNHEHHAQLSLEYQHFLVFESKVIAFQSLLQNFSHSVRQLGCSIGILSSTHAMGEHLSTLLLLFRANTLMMHARNGEGYEKTVPKDPLNYPNMEEFPIVFENLATAVSHFLTYVNSFPEFKDGLKVSQGFEADCKYWASRLQHYSGRFEEPGVRRFVHQITDDLTIHLDDTKGLIHKFTESGIPTIIDAQKHSTSVLLSVTAVSTFFSSVTATTLQYSVDRTETVLQNSVNFFWFLSLISSVTSATFSLVALSFSNATYRSPPHRVPWWISVWLKKRIPAMLLVLAATSFLLGVVLFAFSSSQALATSLMASVLTVICSFGLILVSLWSAAERWVYGKYKGNRVFADVLETGFMEHPIISFTVSTFRLLHVHANSMLRSAQRTLFAIVYTHIPHLICSANRFIIRLLPATCNEESGSLPTAHRFSWPSGWERNDASSTARKSLDVIQREIQNDLDRASRLAAQAQASPKPKMTLYDVAWRVAELQRRERYQVDRKFSEVRRVPLLTVAVSRFQRVKVLQPHVDAVTMLRYHPKANLLFTYSCDRTSTVYDSKEFSVWCQMAHPSGPISEVAWSDKTDHLLTKGEKSVKIWTDYGLCIQKIDRHSAVQAIAWDGEASGTFYCAERIGQRSIMRKMDLEGSILSHHSLLSLDRLLIRKVAVQSTGDRMIALVTVNPDTDGVKPSTARLEKRILVYHVVNAQIEHEVPVLNDVCDLELAESDDHVLVSSSDGSPPQLWRICVKPTCTRLQLVQKYLPLMEPQLSNLLDHRVYAYLGGKAENIVCGFIQDYAVFFWDRLTGTLIRKINASNFGNSIQSLAWHTDSDTWNFSVGNASGEVHVWRCNAPTVTEHVFQKIGDDSFKTSKPNEP